MNRFKYVLAFALTTAQAGQVTTPLTLVVAPTCILVTGPVGDETTVVLECTRGSAAPVSPIEVVGVRVADWRLVSHLPSAGGGELFTYEASPAGSVPANADFY